jgi:ABC-type lipopolysaccharide export system ATPase subunit
VILHHPNRAATHLRRKLVRRLARHSPILSGVGASDKPGAVQNSKVALKFADYGYVLDAGRIALKGKASELLHDDSVVRTYLGGGAPG